MPRGGKREGAGRKATGGTLPADAYPQTIRMTDAERKKVDKLLESLRKPGTDEARN